MTNTNPTLESDYASGYAKGRHAAKEHIPESDNPFRSLSPAFRGWADGHFDELSARRVEIQRRSAFVSAGAGRN